MLIAQKLKQNCSPEDDGPSESITEHEEVLLKVGLKWATNVVQRTTVVSTHIIIHLLEYFTDTSWALVSGLTRDQMAASRGLFII